MTPRKTKLQSQMDHVGNLFFFEGIGLEWIYFEQDDKKKYYILPEFRITPEEYYDEYRQN